MSGVTESCHAPPIEIRRDAGAVIASVDEAITGLLGWLPAQLVGCPSTRFIHPEDQPSAVAAWMAMLTQPGSIGRWRGRYQAADGSWRWVETLNENLLDQPHGIVRTEIRPTDPEVVGIEEELRARGQVLTRLADVLPVGVLQIDADGTLTFTNPRLHTIVDAPHAATITALFQAATEDGQHQLQNAVDQVLADTFVDDLELCIESSLRTYCRLTLRPLTDSNGHVTGAVGCVSDITDHVVTRLALETRASIDPLTKCLNRAAIVEHLAMSIAGHDGKGHGTAVFYIDLDRFKLVNDIYGHAAGDQLLIAATQRLRTALRGHDQIGRLGGDEFLAVCPNVASQRQAIEIADRINKALHTTIHVGEDRVELSASVGAWWTNELTNADLIIASADQAMYAVKNTQTTQA